MDGLGYTKTEARALAAYDDVMDGLEYAEAEARALAASEGVKRAGELLREAAVLVEGKRDRTHGTKWINFSNIARAWSGLLWNILERPLKPSEAALMMGSMKMARTKTGEHNLDDYRDLAGYAGCAGELAEIEREIERERPEEAYWLVHSKENAR